MAVLVDFGSVDFDGDSGGVLPGHGRSVGDDRVMRPDTHVPARRNRDRTRPPGRGRATTAPRVIAAARCAPRSAPVGLFSLLGLGVAVCAAVFGLGVLANAGADVSVPQRTEVVQVREGDSLTGIAEHYAPHSDRAAVVDRIQELNALDGAAVRTGMMIIVPAED